jgi:serine/threonine protein phosphatase 1
MAELRSMLVVGDVHGCHATFQTLLDTYWNPADTLLIQVGDLVDRGNCTPQVLALCRALERQYPERTVFLKGNHEAELVEYWFKGVASDDEERFISNDATLRQYRQFSTFREHLPDDMAWCAVRPLYWEHEAVFVSHAGISAMWNTWQDALKEQHHDGILWNRSPLKHLGKVQIIGHTPQVEGAPVYTTTSNSWNVDTGAVMGLALSAVRISLTGEHLASYSVPTVRSDVPRFIG